MALGPVRKHSSQSENYHIGRFHTRDGLYVSQLLFIHLQNPSKLTEKQVDKVRQIVHPKLRPFHVQIKTYYLADMNSALH